MAGLGLFSDYRYINHKFVKLYGKILSHLIPGLSDYERRQEAELKKFDPRLKLRPWLKYGWFHSKLY